MSTTNEGTSSTGDASTGTTGTSTGTQDQGILGLGDAGSTGLTWDYFIFGAIALVVLVGIISIIVFSVKERRLKGDRMIDMSEI
jgi:hypothetical protein